MHLLALKEFVMILGQIQSQIFLGLQNTEKIN
jgi:hypothetical protein